jgi:glycosyltransferase involved in cell wall biosynthesis
MPSRPIIAQCLECPIHDFGGVETLVIKLIEGLAADFQIVLVSNDPAGSLADSPLAPLIKEHIPWCEPRITQAAAKELALKLKNAGVQLAHFHSGWNYGWGIRVLNQSPIVQVHKAGIPVLSTNHGVFTLFEFCARYRPMWMKLAALPYAWLSKVQAVSHCAAEVAVSRNDLHWLVQWYWPVKNRFRLIYHSKLADEPSAPTAGRLPVILYVGTIGHRKGHVFLVEAFARIAQRHPEWRLLLAGRNATPELYEQILKIRSLANLEDRIEIDHSLPDDAVAERMRTSAIFVMPSLQEGLGLSLQEALYRGCACIASRAGGMQDLIEDGVNGLLVPPGDADALAGALEKLITDGKLRERLNEAARPSVLAKGMTAPQMVENYAKLYESVLGKE